MIDIDQKQGQAQAEFNPQSLTVAAGDQINWRNNTATPHWPAPKGKPKDTWMDYQIPGKLPGQPAPTSQQTLTFGAAMTVDYVCALHPEETGTITVQ
jgi:plastocyanin